MSKHIVCAYFLKWLGLPDKVLKCTFPMEDIKGMRSRYNSVARTQPFLKWKRSYAYGIIPKQTVVSSQFYNQL